MKLKPVEAEKLLRKYVKDESVVKHCLMVGKVAWKIANNLRKKGYLIDPELAMVGGILHDLGRARGKPSHAFKGAEILRNEGYPDYARFCETHGFVVEEAKYLGLPGNYEPKTLEEKVVVYADFRVKKDKVVSLDEKFRYLKRIYADVSEWILEGEKRIRKLEEELTNDLNDI